MPRALKHGDAVESLIGPGQWQLFEVDAGKYDLVVAMYHDQGLIPIKLLAWDSAVNVTCGLPIWRTSPDHGTAFDIAGKGLADPGAMIAAIRMAGQIAANRSAHG